MKRIIVLKSIIFLVFVPLGAFGGFLMDFAVAKLVYPNPCIYHTKPKPTNLLFSTFFDYNGGTGFHPEPSVFSMIFYAVIGGTLGFLFSKFLARSIMSKFTT
jgi:hypothetical protein